MYTPPQFREDRLETLHAFIRDHPFATVVACGAPGLTASHAPLLLDPASGPNGTLRGHLARANPQIHELNGGEALAVFQGPHAYVSPSLYASKRKHGRVVPTWNYVAVHARGRAHTFDEPARLKELLDELTDRHEAGRPQPWRVDDAPGEFLAGALGAIVGVEIVIERLEGAWKLSQNKPVEDRRGVAEGLRSGTAADRAVADLMPD